MKLLIIRPQPAADKTARLAANAGIEPVVMPLFEIAPQVWEAPDTGNFDALLITSANALRHCGNIAASVRQLPLLAVGEPTAKLAREQGFNVELVGDAGKSALLHEAKKRGFANILWLAGKHWTESSLDEEMIAAKAIVYESRALPAPKDFAEYAEKADAIALHSSRAATHFCSLIAETGLGRRDISIVALSRAIAEKAGAGWRNAVTAKTPDDAALLLAAKSLAK